MKPSIGALAIIYVLASAVANGADFDLKGIKLGGKSPGYLGSTTLAGVEAHIACDTDAKGRVIEINAFFNITDYPVVNAAIIEKYGKPTSVEKTPMQNAVGGRFMRITESWVNERGDQLNVVNYVSATGSAVQVVSKEKIDAYNAKLAKAKRDI